MAVNPLKSQGVIDCVGIVIHYWLLQKGGIYMPLSAAAAITFVFIIGVPNYIIILSVVRDLLQM